MIYRRLFTQPRKLATLRAEFDAAVHEGSENGTNPELLALLQGHAAKITQLMSNNWSSIADNTEQWPRFKTRRAADRAKKLTGLFDLYLEKNLRWLDYFVLDPRWLNLTAVNYAANAAREAASEVREARLKFEKEYELTREDLGASPISPEESPVSQDQTGSPDDAAQTGSEDDANAA